MQDDRVLHDVAGALVDGLTIDWAAAESHAADAKMQRLVRELKVIAEIAEVHGSLSLSSDRGPIETESLNLDGVERATASFRDGQVTAMINSQKTDRATLEAALKKKGVQVKTP